jgi:serine/threonine protein kinase, bacterial
MAAAAMPAADVHVITRQEWCMSDPDLRFGERYKVLGQLSAGPSGAVWCGRDLHTGSGCAIRLLEPGLAADTAAAGGLLIVLGQIGRLAHPAIVAVDDVVTGAGWTALVMPLISGESLQARLGRLGSLDPVEAIRLIAQLCDGLAAAHAVGLAHGRIKPSNILLEPGADPVLSVKLTDFGMAALEGRAVNASLRSPAAAVSAAQYQAPELEFAMPATPAADVYAAGAVLYEALAGYPPFSGGRALDIARMHRESPPPRIPDLPDALWPLLISCLAKQPYQRPSARDLASLLRGISPATPGGAVSIRFKRPTSEDLPLFETPRPAAEPTVLIAPEAAVHRSKPRSRRAEIVLTAGLAALASAVAYAFVDGHAGPPTAGAVVLSATGAASGSTVGRGTGTPGGGAGTQSGLPIGSGTPTLPNGGLAPSGGTVPAAAGVPPTGGSAASSPSTSTSSVPVTSTTTTSTSTGGLPIADPIAYLETMRSMIENMAAQGSTVIDANSAGVLENLVLDLENSVIAYQQNGGTAHLQEIHTKISLFDSRLELLLSQGLISQNAANELSTYLQKLDPS